MTVPDPRSYIASDRPLALDECVTAARSAMAAGDIDYDTCSSPGCRVVCPSCGSERMLVSILLRKGALYVRCPSCGTTSCGYWLARRDRTPLVPVHPNHPQAWIARVGNLRGAATAPPPALGGRKENPMRDKYGKPVAVGDRVALLATIKSTACGEEYCNATVTPEENMPPYDHPNVEPTVNSRQLVKLDEPLPFEVIGQEFRDTLTGAKGVASEVVYQKTRCPRLMLEGVDDAGRPFEWWYDFNRLELAKADVHRSAEDEAPPAEPEATPAEPPPPTGPSVN